jgi:hypothetical protein
MSWRAIIFFLLLALVASWQGGRQLGLWLVEQAPDSIASSTTGTQARGQVLDAEGKPVAPQPPQPRIDGTLGVPREMAPVEWTIEAVIASREDANSYKKEGDEDEDEGDESEKDNDERRDRDRDPDGVRTIDVRAPTSGASSTRPVTTPAPLYSWRDALKKELTQCSSVGFFRRPGCIDAAQTKYCGPNKAWGKVAECPDRGTTNMTGG